jgi:hypothetical protein
MPPRPCAPGRHPLAAAGYKQRAAVAPARHGHRGLVTSTAGRAARQRSAIVDDQYGAAICQPTPPVCTWCGSGGASRTAPTARPPERPGGTPLGSRPCRPVRGHIHGPSRPGVQPDMRNFLAGSRPVKAPNAGRSRYVIGHFDRARRRRADLASCSTDPIAGGPPGRARSWSRGRVWSSPPVGWVDGLNASKALLYRCAAEPDGWSRLILTGERWWPRDDLLESQRRWSGCLFRGGEGLNLRPLPCQQISRGRLCGGFNKAGAWGGVPRLRTGRAASVERTLPLGVGSGCVQLNSYALSHRRTPHGQRIRDRRGRIGPQKPWSERVWWAREEVNLRHLPCQQLQGARCAHRRFRRSRSTVGAVVKCFNGLKLNALPTLRKPR